MKKLYLLMAILCLSISTESCASDRFIPASDPGFTYIGRASYTPDKVYWTWPGFQIYCQFTGTSISMKTKPGSGYFMIELDDQAPFKVTSPAKDSLIVIANQLTDGTHRLGITYCIEGLLKKPEFYGLLLDADGRLEGQATLPQRKLEFIGNSITCALGIEGDNSEKTFSYAQQNVYYAYEALTARALHAQYQVVARSGIGIYRNSGGSATGDKAVMPAYYPYTQFARSGETWDFNRYQPDVVCINLGTNDTSAPKYDTALLTEAFKRFIKTLRSHYPKAKIVLLTGTMRKRQRLADWIAAEQEAMRDAHEQGDQEIYQFNFTPADGTLGYGTFMHPSMKQHQKMAQELIPFLQQITGW